MYRIYDLSNGAFIMKSAAEDEFGQFVLVTTGSLSGDWINQRLENPEDSCSMDFRIQEMYHFLSLLKLFDPQFNTPDHGFQEIVSPSQARTQNLP